MAANIVENRRIASADVYRGFVMFLMMAEVLNLQKMARNFPDSNFWAFLGFNQSHVEWVGCSLHDIIQPSFTFLVGVVLPYSLAKYYTTSSSVLFKVIKRALILVLLGVFLRSMDSKSTYWTFEDTLSQIGLGYIFLFLIASKSIAFQIRAFLFIVFAYWLAFVLYPLPNTNFDYQQIGLSADWEHNLKGFSAHWNKNTNLAWAFDQWFLNIFPRESHFYANEGGYSTLSFIPTLATMLLGLLAGNILLKAQMPKLVLVSFIKYGILLIVSGLLLNILGVCPIVKRLWSPSWVLFSGGLCYLLLAIFYYLIDVKQYERPFFWLKIIGMNSIAAYVLAHTVVEFIENSFQIHFGNKIFDVFGLEYSPIVSGTTILVCLWYVLYWLYSKKLFIKI
jgi:predicted acyltransferase